METIEWNYHQINYLIIAEIKVRKLLQQMIQLRVNVCQSTASTLQRFEVLQKVFRLN